MCRPPAPDRIRRARPPRPSWWQRTACREFAPRQRCRSACWRASRTYPVQVQGFAWGSSSPNTPGTYANRIGNASDRHMMPKRDWTEMTWTDVAAGDTRRWIAVLPVAAVEQHGPHLPLGVDSYIAQAYVARVLPLLPADLPATFLPVQ